MKCIFVMQIQGFEKNVLRSVIALYIFSSLQIYWKNPTSDSQRTNLLEEWQNAVECYYNALIKLIQMKFIFWG